jgi:D-beta-D-heptose 7-phosphate kinase / D-beta-D-heptose 1-phosphate adenosyltransferase
VVRGRRDAPIPEKARVRASGQSIARLDRGAGGPVENGPWPPEAAEAIRDAHAVLVSDYGGGVTASRPLREALASAADGTAVVWDPHARGSEPVPGCLLATPNRAEAGVVGWTPATALRVARTLASRWRAEAVCITLGADGAVLALPGGGVMVPAPAVAPTDVCGAGDRFASAATRSLAEGASTAEAVEAAVHAASAFVASGAPWTPATSATASGLTATTDGSPAASRGAAPRRGPVVVCTSGCFDLLHAGHVRMLRSARALGDRLVVCLNDDDSVARLKGEGRPIVPAEERRELLLALDCVDDVVTFPEDTPERVLDRLRPDVFVKGADYRLEELPEARLVESWGGETVILPYEAGRSTTELIERSRSTAGTGAGAAGPRW